MDVGETCIRDEFWKVSQTWQGEAGWGTEVQVEGFPAEPWRNENENIFRNLRVAGVTKVGMKGLILSYWWAETYSLGKKEKWTWLIKINLWAILREHWLKLLEI